MNSITLPAATSIQQVTLRTRRLAQLSAFYQNILGLREISSTRVLARLSASGQEPAQLILEQDESAPLRIRQQPGLYHVAWLVPNRQELARVLQHLFETKWPLQGFGDHLVSEAIYLSDPDGNGIEVYADRARETWPMVNRQVQMDTLSVDVPGLLALLTDETPAWQGLPVNTIIGHIHLQVSSLDQAKDFYTGLLKFELMQENYPGALFVAAGGYHHHIGLNTWHSQNTAPGPENQTGLVNFSIRVPDKEVFESLKKDLRAAGIPIEEQAEERFRVQDPDQISIVVQR